MITTLHPCHAYTDKETYKYLGSTLLWRDTKLKTKSDELTDIYNELDSHIVNFLGQWSASYLASSTF